MATAKLYSEAGEAKGTVDLPTSLFEQPVHKQALYEAVRNYLANQRQGTHDTKTRAEVKASTAKMYRQKGTGRARAGYRQSPVWRGGGVAFGPKPRLFIKKVNRKVARLAFRHAFSDLVDVLLKPDDIIVVSNMPVYLCVIRKYCTHCLR